MEKNNLDNLFREKFKDFSETPNARVWENIEASLDQKKKRRILPIWWQLGGAAAALALLLYFVNPFASISISEQNNSTVVDVEKTTIPEVNGDNTYNNGENSFKTPAQGADQVTSTDNTLDKEAQLEENTLQRKSNNIPLQNSVSARKQYQSKKEGVLVSNYEKQSNPSKNQNLKQTTPNQVNASQESAVATTNTAEKNLKSFKENMLSNPLESVIPNSEDTKVVTVDSQETDETISIYDAIEEKEKLEKEEAVVAEKLDKRWAIGPSVAPVYYNSLGEGSPIHSNFAPNNKTGKLNLSYGLSVTYNVSKKLSVSSGVHKVDFGYNTNDVVFSSSLTASTEQAIDNINYSETSRNIVVQSKNSDAEPSEFLDDNASIGGGSVPLDGRMVQQLGYIEVPVELNYSLMDKKFGIDLIGGFSSLFLVDNAVSLESGELVTEMGEANNANAVNFSTNVGVGFNYKISQNLQMNIEPIFKYQLNTFSQTAGNFRPYAFGVYSGLNFRF